MYSLTIGLVVLVVISTLPAVESFTRPSSALNLRTSTTTNPNSNTKLDIGSFLDGILGKSGGGQMDSTSSTNLPITTETIDLLSSGVSAEVKSCIPPSARRNNGKPPLVFIHGSFHAAWCWTERYFPYFASKGYPCVAISLRGTSGTFAGEGVKKVKIAEHVADVSALLDYIQSSEGMNLSNKPVLISHSFGGLAVMKLIEEDPAAAQAKIGGAALLCSVPPSGNGKMTMRFLRRSLRDSWKITAGLAMKKCNDDPELCRELFFGGGSGGDDGDDLGVTDKDIERYQGNFCRDVDATIDLGDLAKKLPSARAENGGRASFASYLPPSLVVGATDDFIVDKEGVDETAQFFDVEPVFVDSPHDVMLTNKWQNGADAILNWLERDVNV
mmetsp:Transcript_21993/g.63061  ORF Transcript_21993/g.63061 Transcript_21993/m.63061 type:complete len:386 (+) Transcript_21993:2-1159(+)